MSNQANLDLGFWEKITDFLSSLSEGIVGFLGRIFGSSNDRLVRSLGYIRPRGSDSHTVAPGSVLDKVNSLEYLMKALDDRDFPALTGVFRRLLTTAADAESEKTPGFIAGAAVTTVHDHHFSLEDFDATSRDFLTTQGHFPVPTEKDEKVTRPVTVAALQSSLFLRWLNAEDRSVFPSMELEVPAHKPVPVPVAKEGKKAAPEKDVAKNIVKKKVELRMVRVDSFMGMEVPHFEWVETNAPAAPPPAAAEPAAEEEPIDRAEALTELFRVMQEALPAKPTLNDILPFAFAACREVGWRSKKMRHFDVQIIGGAILHEGKIAEMVTGEGKTLVATLPAYLNAIEGKGVHVVTVNDYLARRDCEWMSPIYHGLGVSCSFIQSDMDPIDRRMAYDCDITYGTNSEFGFDYLRDNMRPARWGDPSFPPQLHQSQRQLPEKEQKELGKQFPFAIIDEVDNVLIDEARTPLIISGPSSHSQKDYATANKIAIQLTRLEKAAQSKLRALGHGVNIPDHPLSAAEAEAKETQLPEHITSLSEEKAAEGAPSADTAIQPAAAMQGVQAGGALPGGTGIKEGDPGAKLASAIQDPAVTQGIKAGSSPELADAEVPDIAKEDEEGAAGDAQVESYVASANVEKKEKRLGFFFEVKEKERSCHLTDAGVRKAEELAGVESFYTAGNMEWPHMIDNALKAHHLYHKDKQYMVMPDPETGIKAIIIVDEFTGRPMHGRQWSDGLHQAVEAKHESEGVKVKEETQTLATVTLQNFFRLYQKLAGMTGTAMTEANEFWKIYKLDVVAIPTNQPLTRVNFPDLVYLKEKEKWEAVVTELERINKYDTINLKNGEVLVGTIKSEEDDSYLFIPKDTREAQTVRDADVESVEYKGRPVLVGTTNVAQSEKLSKMLLRPRVGVKHELLNAKPEHAHKEAEIVAQAGRLNAVTISTNMAGRGTDIILGGNPETLAWSRLKSKYATRLDVPDAEWKALVAQIETEVRKVNELDLNMKEEGRVVAEMGGLHIIGTERHESRRIDNQLRGRAGRQGDPGSSRFFVSLEDDLMRIFAGEFMERVLTWAGMEPGQAIESSMVSRRIESAQKKVEEQNFDIRKNLLEYDEVMDHQRKRVYGYRQEILNDANPRLRIWNMMTQQIDLALKQFLDPLYGAWRFARIAETQLSLGLAETDFDRSIVEEADQTSRDKSVSNIAVADFAHCTFADAEQVARDKAVNNIQTLIQEALEENLDTEVEESEWNWQAMADRVKKICGLHEGHIKRADTGKNTVVISAAGKEIAVTLGAPTRVFALDGQELAEPFKDPAFKVGAPVLVRPDDPVNELDIRLGSLKAVGREALPDLLFKEAGKTVRRADLSDGKPFFEDGWGYEALAQWADRKFQIKIDPKQFNADTPHEQVRRVLVSRVRELYRDKEAVFPVTVAMRTFMNDKGEGGAIGKNYDRQGLYHWYSDPFRFWPTNELTEDYFVKDKPKREDIEKTLSDIAKKAYPQVIHEEFDAKLREVAFGAKELDAAGAQAISEWVKVQYQLDVPAEYLQGVSLNRVRDIVWNVFDFRYRPEMRRMERSLLLGQLDTAWKEHLLEMDHLRQGIGLVTYAQVDPKTEYKRVGMKEFESMWEELGDQVTSNVFKVEHNEAFDETVWIIGNLRHDAAPQLQVPEGGIQAQQQAGIAGSQQTDKKPEPIRNRGEKVGRNDPCPCGSGKKYKKCHGASHAVR